MIIYSNSCSFGITTDHTIYPEVISSKLNAKLVNAGMPASCNRRIIRTSIRDLISLKQNNSKIFSLIGLTFISRTELWQPWLPPTKTDGDFHSLQIDHTKIDWSKGLDTPTTNIHKYADTRVADYYKHWLSHFSPEAEICNLLTDVIMFSNWCKNNSIQYLIFCNTDVFPQVDLNSPFLSSLVYEIKQDPNIIDPWEFSFGTYALSKNYVPKDVKIYGKHGHPGELAHIDFAEHLLLQYINV